MKAASERVKPWNDTGPGKPETPLRVMGCDSIRENRAIL